MRKSSLLLGMAFCFAIVLVSFEITSADSGSSWTKTFGGVDLDWAYSIIQTSDGGYVLAGSTESYGAGSRDFWLVKTDSLGNEQWSKTFGGTDWEAAQSVIQTSDGGYALAGDTSSYGAGGNDFWLVKTDSLGNEEWTKTFGGENGDEASSLIQTSDGGYALAGFTNSHGSGGADFWLVKTDPLGNEQWAKTFGGEDSDVGRSIIQTSDGGYALAGYTESYAAGGYDFWLVKTDSAGNEEWSKRFGGNNWDWAFSLIQTSDGGYALAGDTISYGAGGEDFWLVKTDNLGNVEWSENFGGENWDVAFSIIQTSDGGYALAGYTESYGAGGEDFWLVKTDSLGNVEWSENFGGNDMDRAWSVIQTSDGGYAIAGYTKSYGSGYYDLWLVKTDSLGNVEGWRPSPEGGEIIYVALGVIVVVVMASVMILYKRARGK